MVRICESGIASFSLAGRKALSSCKLYGFYVRKGVYLTVGVCFQCHGDGFLHGQALEEGGQLGELRVAEQQQPSHF